MNSKFRTEHTHTRNSSFFVKCCFVTETEFSWNVRKNHHIITMHTYGLQLNKHKAKGKGKVLSLHTTKAYMWRRGIAPLILNLCTKWSNSHPGCFTSRYPTGDWVGPTACLYILDNKKIPCPARNWSPIHPIHSLVTIPNELPWFWFAASESIKSSNL